MCPLQGAHPGRASDRLIKPEDAKVGMKIRLIADLNDPWTKLEVGTIGTVKLIQDDDPFTHKMMLHCHWEDGSSLGVWVDDPIEPA